MMILPKASLQSAVLTRISSDTIHQSKFIQHFAKFNQQKGHIQTTLKPEPLDRTKTWKKSSTNLMNALTHQPIFSATKTSTTAHPALIASMNTTHLTMTSNIVSALMEENSKDDHSAHSRIMVLILIGIFMFISLLITMVVVVMCKKKNSVFMLQKCEQESDLELDEIEEINAELDTSESEYEQLDSNISQKRSESYPCFGKLKYMEENYHETDSLRNSVDLDLQRKSKKSVNLDLQRNSRKSVGSVSPSSTPLLINRDSGTGSCDLTQEVLTCGKNYDHSQDTLTGSLNSDKYVICLDKFSIHSQHQTESKERNVKSSHEKIKRVARSKTFDDTGLQNKHSSSSQANQAKEDFQTTSSQRDKLYYKSFNVTGGNSDERDKPFQSQKNKDN